MTNKKEIYKCEICGNIIEVLHWGAGELICCGQPMKIQVENTVDAAKEKHIPVIEGNKVIVGSTEHPMNEKHYIEWIEATGENGKISKKYLNSNEKPEAEFCFKPIFARTYCNLHELWKS